MADQPGTRITDYRDLDGIKHVTFAMVEAAHGRQARRRLEHWMGGQTMLRLPSGEAGVFASDYERWLRAGPITD